MYLGINLAGGEFGATIPGEHGKNYTFPDEGNIKYYADAGFRLIRLPYKWERWGQDVERIRQFLDTAHKYECKVVLDCHNYLRYYGELLPADDTSLADHWREVVTEFKDHPAIRGWGIMNEPHDTEGRWPAIAQRVVTAIEEIDNTHRIYVMGDHWGGAHSWKDKNGDLRVEGQNVIWEAHQYFDSNSSGAYRGDYASEGADPEIGVRRLRPFTDWLKENNFKGVIGEFGNPPEQEWLFVMQNFVQACIDQGIEEAFYWAGGPWWGPYPLSAEDNAPQYQLMKAWIASANQPEPSPEPQPEPQPQTWIKTKTWEHEELAEVEKGVDNWLYRNSKRKKPREVIQVKYIGSGNKFGGYIVYR